MRRVSGIDTQRNSTAAATYGVKLNVRALIDGRPAQRLDRPEHADQGDVLLQADEVVHQRRDDAADGLGSTTERIVCPDDRPSERAAARWLSWTLSIPARNTSAT